VETVLKIERCKVFKKVKIQLNCSRLLKLRTPCNKKLSRFPENFVVFPKFRDAYFRKPFPRFLKSVVRNFGIRMKCGHPECSLFSLKFEFKIRSYFIHFLVLSMTSSSSLARIPSARFQEFEQLWWEEEQRCHRLENELGSTAGSVNDPSFLSISGESDECIAFVRSLMDCTKEGRRPKLTFKGKAALQYLLDVASDVAFTKEYLLEARDPKSFIAFIKKKWYESISNCYY